VELQRQAASGTERNKLVNDSHTEEVTVVGCKHPWEAVGWERNLIVDLKKEKLPCLS